MVVIALVLIAAGVLGYTPAAPRKKKAVIYEDDDGNTWGEKEDEDVTDKPSFEVNLMDENMVRMVLCMCPV
jgi:hypothetical protein